MEIKVCINDNSEWFNDVDDAIDYLENHREDGYEDDEDEPMLISSPVLQEDPKIISLSKKINRDIIGQSLDSYLLKGYVITYEGKTGYTLEKF